jgi:hypothetical protein
MIRVLALAAACTLSACASTYVANPNDPVDMAAALGDRGAQYVGMGAVCDANAGGDYRRTMTELVALEQNRLGVLRGLVNRAYHGEATDALRAHMQVEMAENGLSAAEFCSEAVQQARVDLNQRADTILALGNGPLTLSQARDRGYIE